MKKLFLFLLLIIAASPISGANKEKFLEELKKILADPYFNSAGISVDIFDLDDKKEIYSYDHQKLLHPASNMKVITTITAMEFLGIDYEFTTKLAGTGKLENGIYTGDLYFIGGMDPDFTSHDLQKFTDHLVKSGVKEIRGNLYVDISLVDSLYWGVGWMWDDDPGSDFPYMTALNINDAGVKIFYESGKIGEPVNYRVEPYSDYYTVSNYSVTVAEDTSDLTITRGWKERNNEIQIKGFQSVSETPDSITINLYRPELYFLRLFEEQLQESGILFYGKSDTGRVPVENKIMYKFSRFFDQILDNLNKESDNLSAEMTLRALGLEGFGKPASAENGIKMIDSLITIIGLDPENYRIVDGSGVSHYNLVTPELMIALLNHIYYKYPDKYTRFEKSLPIAGIDGTLENRMTRGEAYNKIFAKTGTLSGVSTLSGYANTNSGGKISFSIFVQNFVGKTSRARYYQDRICELIVKYL